MTVRTLCPLAEGDALFSWLGTRAWGALISRGFLWRGVPDAFPYPARTPSERFHCGQVRSVDVFLVSVTLLVAFL